MPEWIAFVFSLRLNEVIPLEYACFPILPSRIIRTEPSACKHKKKKKSNKQKAIFIIEFYSEHEELYLEEINCLNSMNELAPKKIINENRILYKN